MTNLTLVVVTSLLTAAEPAWRDVAEALVVKHAGEARVVRLTAEPSVTNALAQLSAARPTHVAFVMRPEEIDFPTTVALKRMMRDLDDDPYDDALWGLVTGPTAADAHRIAASREPREIRTALATTGIADEVAPEGFTCLSDAYPAGEWRVKDATGKVTRFASSNDLSRVFADGWRMFDPQLVLTSSHASERNLEMPFSRGNIVPAQGRFWTCPDLTLIDYLTGQAKDGVPAAALEALAPPQREKVWLAAGNCLIADNLPPYDRNMVMTALGFGKVNQFVGYIATTWFGEIGWGTWERFAKGSPLVEAYFEANRRLIEELEETVSNAGDFRPVFANARDYNRLRAEANAFRFKAAKPIADPQKFLGRLWDRDATVFYGDPLLKVTLAPRP